MCWEWPPSCWNDLFNLLEWCVHSLLFISVIPLCYPVMPKTSSVLPCSALSKWFLYACPTEYNTTSMFSTLYLSQCYCCDWTFWAESMQSFTLTSSNNRDHMLCSLYYCLFVPHTYRCYSEHTFRLWRITHSMTAPTERVPHYYYVYMSSSGPQKRDSLFRRHCTVRFAYLEVIHVWQTCQ